MCEFNGCDCEQEGGRVHSPLEQLVDAYFATMRDADKLREIVEMQSDTINRLLDQQNTEMGLTDERPTLYDRDRKLVLYGIVAGILLMDEVVFRNWLAVCHAGDDAQEFFDWYGGASTTEFVDGYLHGDVEPTEDVYPRLNGLMQDAFVREEIKAMLDTDLMRGRLTSLFRDISLLADGEEPDSEC